MDKVVDCSQEHNRAYCLTKELRDHVISEDHSSPFLKLLLYSMRSIGCPVTPAVHIVVERCYPVFDGFGGFDSSNNEIVLCEEKFASLSKKRAQKTMDMILSHELVHAFDHCRAQVEFYDNPRHSMCSEIRAATLSGQCMLKNKVMASMLGGVRKYHKKCVKNYAKSSFKALHPKWNEKETNTLLDSVFEPCYNDHEPFDRLPLTAKDAELSYKAYVTRNRYNCE